MGKVSYSPGIEYVQGSLTKPKKVDGHSHGDYLIGTHRTAPTQNPDCTRIYVRKADVYKRTTPLTPDETAARARFSAVSKAIKTRRGDLSKLSADQAAFRAQKDEPGGKKTMTAWYWMVEGQAYDQQH